MGVHQNISYDKYPNQGKNLGKLVKVCFNYDTSKTMSGIIVRDDREEPGLTVIELENKRIVLAKECQYSLL